jgi:NhaP-type Na+/H+ or K+/H+ antiporter
MIEQFFILSIISTAIGVSLALLGSWVLKIMPRRGETCVAAFRESTMIVIIGYTSYISAEAFGYSGVISLFCCGITLSHYAYYNIS